MTIKKTEHSDKALLVLNWVEIAIGVASLLTFIVVAAGGWYVLNYRVSASEGDITALRAVVGVGQTNEYHTREMIIRIDERLKTVQRALKIPTE